MAERCPHCERITTCLLRAVQRYYTLFFLKTSVSTDEASGFCTECYKTFHCETYRYVCVVPVKQAKSLAIEELLARTNPSLAERVQMKEQIAVLGGDTRFAEAYQQLEEMHAGRLRSRFFEQLLNWERLPEEARTSLAWQIADRARVWKFARYIAPGFPSGVGCLPVMLTALVVWLVLFLPALALRNTLMASVSFLIGPLAGTLMRPFLLGPQIRRWTRNVLIPECSDANVSFASFVEVVDDLVGSPLDRLETLWAVKLELKTICEAANAARESQ
jgi:hypothetical protein